MLLNDCSERTEIITKIIICNQLPERQRDEYILSYCPFKKPFK